MVTIIDFDSIPRSAWDRVDDVRRVLRHMSKTRLSGARGVGRLTVVPESTFGDSLHEVSHFDFEETPLRAVHLEKAPPDDSDW